MEKKIETSPERDSKQIGNHKISDWFERLQLLDVKIVKESKKNQTRFEVMKSKDWLTHIGYNPTKHEFYPPRTLSKNYFLPRD